MSHLPLASIGSSSSGSRIAPTLYQSGLLRVNLSLGTTQRGEVPWWRKGRESPIWARQPERGAITRCRGTRTASGRVGPRVLCRRSVELSVDGGRLGRRRQSRCTDVLKRVLASG